MKSSSHISRIMRNKGVTLIELLVAVAITVIVGASIVGALYSGRSAWESGDGIIRRHQNARAAIDFISRDLQQAFVFPEGAEYEADFQYPYAAGGDDSLLFTMLAGSEAVGFELFWVEYRLHDEVIERRAHEYDATSLPGWDPVAWDIDVLEFTFYSRDPATGAWEDDPAWGFDSEGRLPERVKISVTPLDSDDDVVSNVKIPLSALRPYLQP